MKAPPLVYLAWVDACGDTEERTADEHRARGLKDAATVGWLLDETEEQWIVAGERLTQAMGEDDEDVTYRYVTHVPKGWRVSISYLNTNGSVDGA
jgi:hypothetical protein